MARLPRSTPPRRLAAALAVLLAVAAFAGCDQKGADPTQASVEATVGEFAIATTTVAAGSGFGGGTIYYPTSTAQGRYGAVVVTPGFLADQSYMSWYGSRVASHGFVVFTIDTNSIYDNPDTRATEMLAALDYLTSASSVKDRVDPNRLAVMGWSMGGGGALKASTLRPSLRASIALAPWSTTADWSAVTVPTLVVACQNDTIAPVAGHALPFYNGLPAALPKVFLEIKGQDHFCVTSLDNDAPSRTAIARTVISWLKRYVDTDTRYTQFLCPGLPVDATVSTYTDTCPF